MCEKRSFTCVLIITIFSRLRNVTPTLNFMGIGQWQMQSLGYMHFYNRERYQPISSTSLKGQIMLGESLFESVIYPTLPCLCRLYS